MSAPRAYIHYTTPTINHLRNHYHRQPMREIAAELGFPARKLYELAEREGIQKRKRKK